MLIIMMEEEEGMMMMMMICRRTHKIDCVLFGADRVSANGDVANKIGTYNVRLTRRLA